MVELNFDVRRPPALVDLGRVVELAEWRTENGHIRLGAAVPYSRVIAELGDRLPGLAMAARTVGSPQIRNRGTVGGNLGSASPAGDGLPPLYASDAEVEVASTRSEEHTSELQSRQYLVCRLLLEKKISRPVSRPCI